ncbi:MAG: hypothetical protein GY853_16455 [PVC group bacterium]|nr:hypothetical protein [PVC group bacterium]
MSKILKAYFAHGWRSKSHPDKQRILDILKERKVEVIDPFVGEDEMCAKYGEEDYYPNCNYKLGRAIWLKDLQHIRECDMVVAWIPEGVEGRFMGTSYEMCYAFMQYPPKFMQIISPLKHPFFAYLISGGNQHFTSIEAFEKLRKEKW